MTDHASPPRPRLPDVALPPAAGGDPVTLRAHRRGTVLVLLCDRPEAEDVAYLRTLAAADEALRGWDGRVLVIATRPDALPPDAGASFPVLVDAVGAVAAAAGVGTPAVVVADQWGEVHAAIEARDGAPWPAPATLEEWLRFIAVRCAG